LASTEPASGLDRGYWLQRCLGFSVYDEDGRVGVVDSVDCDGGRLTLAVRSGMFGKRVLHVRGDDVEVVIPRSERLWLAPGVSAPLVARRSRHDVHGRLEA